jgi:hypothetical protein
MNDETRNKAGDNHAWKQAPDSLNADHSDEDTRGFLTISEYNNKGDLSLETPIEPALHVQRTKIGRVSNALHNDTLLVALFPNVDCEVAFVMDDGHFVGDGPFNIDDIPDGVHFVPLAGKSEVTRIVHLNAKLRIAVR